MPRNLFERCEVVFPVKDKSARDRIQNEILRAYLADTSKARLMQEDGGYIRPEGSSLKEDSDGFSSQEFLMRLAEGKVDLGGIPTPGHMSKAAKDLAAAASNSVDEKSPASAPKTTKESQTGTNQSAGSGTSKQKKAVQLRTRSRRPEKVKEPA